MSPDGHLLKQWVVLRLDSAEYALPVASVIEVLRMVALRPLPEAPAWVAGLLNLRGTAIVVLDLRQRLGLPPRPPDLNTPIVVLQTAGEPLGLIADEVVEIVALPPEGLKPADHLPGSGDLFAALAHAGERVLLVLRLDRLGRFADVPASLGVTHVAT
jgi:purine-binding chemotaxis protein CheW